MKIAILTPLNPRTGISSYSEVLALELSKLGEGISLISPYSTNNKLIKQNQIKITSPNEYNPNNYDINHFQLGNSSFHEFQIHILKKYLDEFHNTKVVTTVHDARNFDGVNFKCNECLSLILHNYRDLFHCS